MTAPIEWVIPQQPQEPQECMADTNTKCTNNQISIMIVDSLLFSFFFCIYTRFVTGVLIFMNVVRIDFNVKGC